MQNQYHHNFHNLKKNQTKMLAKKENHNYNNQQHKMLNKMKKSNFLN